MNAHSSMPAAGAHVTWLGIDLAVHGLQGATEHYRGAFDNILNSVELLGTQARSA